MIANPGVLTSRWVAHGVIRSHSVVDYATELLLRLRLAPSVKCLVHRRDTNQPCLPVACKTHLSMELNEKTGPSNRWSNDEVDQIKARRTRAIVGGRQGSAQNAVHV